MQYDIDGSERELEQILPQLNKDQTIVFDKIIVRVNSPNQLENNAFFIDGPGGCGKTFIYKTILFWLKFVVSFLADASSGIAVQLLEGARTAHSRFKIPF